MMIFSSTWLLAACVPSAHLESSKVLDLNVKACGCMYMWILVSPPVSMTHTRLSVYEIFISVKPHVL